MRPCSTVDRRAALGSALVLGVCVASCEVAAPDAVADCPSPDSADPDAATAPVAWGGGSLGDGSGFVEWDDGKATPVIIRGPQGGQHIWVSVRCKGFHPKKIRLGVEMFDAETGDAMKPGRVEVTISLKPDVEAWSLHAGIPAFVKEPCKVKNRKLRVKFDVMDLYGVHGQDEAFITPTWDGLCGVP
ncbi:MAG: hypothetical protein EXR79_11900 [Myxococcales bacterium]|nr:hypothetical protein [Myxococcales bacterium]